MKNKNFWESLYHAAEGLGYALKNERNFKTHFLLGSLAFMLASVLRLQASEIAVILLCIALVLVAELINTAIEKTVDLVCNERYSELGKIAKDTAAGAVLTASIFSSFIGLVIFINGFAKIKSPIADTKSELVFLAIFCTVIGIIIFIMLNKRGRGYEGFLIAFSDFIFSVLSYGISLFIFLYSKSVLLMLISLIISFLQVFVKKGNAFRALTESVSALLISIGAVFLFLHIIVLF